MRIDDEVIDRIPEEGGRLVALALVAQADHAAERLAAGSDREALHDFRVALRRLRTTLRAFRPWLKGSVRRRTEKRLRKLARATNGPRDAEVQLAWLMQQRHILRARQQAGLDFICERYVARRDAAKADLDRLLTRYRRISGKLGRSLQTYEGRLDVSSMRSAFGGVLAALLLEQLDGLTKRVNAIHGARDEENIHRA